MNNKDSYKELLVVRVCVVLILFLAFSSVSELQIQRADSLEHVWFEKSLKGFISYV